MCVLGLLLSYVHHSASLVARLVGEGDSVPVQVASQTSTFPPSHVGYVHQCLHKREPCGFSTFFNVSVATNVTARDARVTSRTNFQ